MKNNSNVQVLLSTMNLTDYNYQIKEMNIKDNFVIINQKTQNEIADINYINNKKKIITYHEKGLSRSRNRALFHSNCNYLLISDDDMYYYDNYDLIIEDAYKKYKDADVICFLIDYEDKNKKKKIFKEGKLSYVKSLKISSVQITFKKDSIINNNIKFDENFGSGSMYKFGEDNIFMYDCLKKGLNIYYIPISIGILREKRKSSWFSGFDILYLKNRGASFARMTKKFYWLLNLQFIVRKRGIFKKEKISLIKCVISIFKGSHTYIKRNLKKYKIYFCGDFRGNTGPAIVNKNIINALSGRVSYSKYSNSFFRIFDLIKGIVLNKYICFCSLSKLDLYGIKICKLLHKKSFYIMHGYSLLESKINGTKNNNTLNENYILNNVDVTICVSKFAKNYIENCTHKYKCTFKYVYNGLDWYKLYDGCDHKKKTYQIMSTGGDLPIKNNLVVCEAIKKLIKNNSKYKKLKYIIVGKKMFNDNVFVNYPFVEFYNTMPYLDCLGLFLRM